MAIPTYEHIAAVIAHYLYQNEYGDDGGHAPMRHVDNACSSMLQIPTGVLYRLDILKPIDDSERRSVFLCSPSEFESRAAQNKTKGCSYDTLVLALICLVERNVDGKWGDDDSDLRRCLIDLCVLERLGPDPTKVQVSWLPWTPKKADYDELYDDWPRLL